MEVSDFEVALEGQELIQAVASQSGLPELLARSELDYILDQSGQSSNDLTLDQLRAAMLTYLETLHVEFSKECSSEI